MEINVWSGPWLSVHLTNQPLRLTPIMLPSGVFCDKIKFCLKGIVSPTGKRKRTMKKPEKLSKDYQPEGQAPPGMKAVILWVLVMVALAYLMNQAFQSITTAPRDLSYSQFCRDLAAGQVRNAEQTENVIQGQYQDGSRYRVIVPERDEEILRQLREKTVYSVKQPRTMLMIAVQTIFFYVLPLVLIFFLFYYRGRQEGGRLLAFGKSRARQFVEGSKRITFAEVAGVDEAKEELQEIIEFLKDPKKFQRLGGKIPKGVLLMGPPGTGKTLLAKAVAGEAGVPFFNISGSDFVEMFVGVGASRVRDLFEQAKRSARASGRGCIIFIDEIDAVGRQRFAGIGGGHDEREQTLNALLVEMDGFDTQEGVVLVAATNRPDVLDPALLRPGRFDRRIVIDRPDIRGREAIFRVHTKGIKLEENVNVEAIARQTPGFSGADIANMVNEAALLAARRNKAAVEMAEFQAAIERIIAGPEKKSRIINQQEKRIVAYHESGHSLLSFLIPKVDPLHKVSIIPRGVAALGYTIQVPLEDRNILSRDELMGRLIVLLGGRAAEEIVFGDTTTGAHNDLEVVTETARRMVCEYGMSPRLGHLTFGRRESQVFLGRDYVEGRNYSEETALIIDQEVRKIVDEAYDRARGELERNRDSLEKLAQTLMEKEVMDAGEVKELLRLDKEIVDGGGKEGTAGRTLKPEGPVN